MNSEEWESSSDPVAMLKFLTTPFGERSIEHGGLQYTVSGRKLRLWCCACCLLAGSRVEDVDKYEEKGYYDEGGENCSDEGWARGWTANTSKVSQKAKAELLRCIVGNTGNDALELKEAWLTWQNGTVPRIAEAIYRDRAFEDMPVLADALIDAGCPEDEVCQHCHNGFVIVRTVPGEIGADICRKCNSTGRVPNAIIAHCRETTECYECGGRGTVGVSHEPCSTAIMNCPRCAGIGRILAQHARGCFVIDLLAGKE